MLNRDNQNRPIIPAPILEIGKKLIKSGFRAYLVGGSVRDLLLKQKVKDFDLATDAKPEEILKIFPDSFYNNTFGTVGVKIEKTDIVGLAHLSTVRGTSEERSKPYCAGTASSTVACNEEMYQMHKSNIVEITTFRKEGRYSDKRHPDSVSFTKNIEDDLERRDFTVNALALDLSRLIKGKGRKEFGALLEKIKPHKTFLKFEKTLSESEENRGPGIEGEKENLILIREVPQLGSQDYPDYPYLILNLPDTLQKQLNKYVIDLYSGMADLERKLIRAVKDPDIRFNEDALRLIRAVRFAVELGFKIEKGTAESIKKNVSSLKNISRERIKDELIKIIGSPWPAEGIMLLHKLGLLKEILPVLEEGVGVEQNWHHIYSVFNHSVLALKFCFSDDLSVRLAAILHDAAKPRVKRPGKNGQATFYNHEVEGERLARKSLTNLHFPTDIIDETALLVRHHMFNYDPALHNERTVRHTLHRVGGQERMQKLLILRIGDRLGSGCKKGEVYKLRKFKYLIEKVSFDPISLKQLKINGKDLIKKLNIQPGPVIGDILDWLLSQALDNPGINKKEKLLDLAEKLWQKEKARPGFIATEQKKAVEFLEGRVGERDAKLQEKYWVKE